MRREPLLSGISIRAKLSLLIFAVFLALAAGHFLINHFFVEPQFELIEREQARKNLQRVADALHREVEHLDLTLLDWSSWDASYEFVAGERPGFIGENLAYQTLIDLELEMMAFYNPAGELVWGHRLNQARDGLLPLLPFAASRPPVAPVMHEFASPQDAYIRGFLQEAHGALLIAARPILRSAGDSAPRGTLVFGRNLDGAWLDAVRERTANDFRLEHMPVYTTPPPEVDIQIRTPSESELIVSRYIQDVFGRPAFLLSLELDRDVTLQAYYLLNYAYSIAMVALIVMLVLLLFVLNRLLIRPLSLLTGYLASIRADGNYARRLGLQRGDEIGALADELDATLEHIENQDRALKRLSRIDSLTGLANRRTFDSSLQTEWKRMGRSNTPISLLMCDIDGFKRYNDTFGHVAGDAALVAVAHCLKQHAVRSADLACRYGGEEFAVILPNTNHESAMAIAERMREAAQELSLEVDGQPERQPLTISIGVATASPDHRGDTSPIIEEADRALYEAKRGGRNTVRGRLL
jgi:diguanylate cyclase (GGDEF)-like protein